MPGGRWGCLVLFLGFFVWYTGVLFSGRESRILRSHSVSLRVKMRGILRDIMWGIGIYGAPGGRPAPPTTMIDVDAWRGLLPWSFSEDLRNPDLLLQCLRGAIRNSVFFLKQMALLYYFLFSGYVILRVLDICLK